MASDPTPGALTARDVLTGRPGPAPCLPLACPLVCHDGAMSTPSISNRTTETAIAQGTWVIDLDGVIWLTGTPIPGSPEAIQQLGRAGINVLFATNNADPSDQELLNRLQRAGIVATSDMVVTSAHAAASMLSPGMTVLTLGGEGVDHACRTGGAVVVPAADPAPAGIDAVIVGLTHHFDYDMLGRAATAVRNGARLIGTNGDPTHPTPSGLLPGSGALVAAVATAAEVDPEFAGKPYEAMVRLLRQRAGDITVVVGDRPATDGLLARRLGVPFALVRSGVLPPGAAADPSPDFDHADLAALVDAALRR